MTVKRFHLISSLVVFTLGINFAQALPMDWSGVFGVDTHMLNNVCRTSDDVTAQTPKGTQGIAGDCDANFQTYIMKLNPQIIVNDGVTLKGEFSTGHIRGGFAGDNSGNNRDASGNNSYFFTTPAQRSSLNVNQMYMELYADTALLKLGRMSKHYGMGIVFDNGQDPWDRFLTMYDGIEAEMKIGNFSIIPYWAKISTYDDDTTAGSGPNDRPSGSWDVREIGITAKYDNKNRDLVVSVLYGKRFSEAKNSLYNANDNTTPTNSLDRGKTEITVIEPYIAKRWNKFKLAAEASIQTGDYGNVYQDGVDNKSKLSANAYILEGKYDFNPKWDVGLIAGQVDGDDGQTGKFEALYLHPNYHIANLMFRYHYPSFNNGTKSIFDSSITNTRFYKLHGSYKSDKWTWKTAVIMAKAMETAKNGQRAYHHEENYSFTASQDQADDLGFEVDFGFDYKWNPNVTISAYYGYWKVGDYYAFSNGTEELSLENVHGGGLSATLEF